MPFFWTARRLLLVLCVMMPVGCNADRASFAAPESAAIEPDAGTAPAASSSLPASSTGLEGTTATSAGTFGNRMGAVVAGTASSVGPSSVETGPAGTELQGTAAASSSSNTPPLASSGGLVADMMPLDPTLGASTGTSTANPNDGAAQVTTPGTSASSGADCAASGCCTNADCNGGASCVQGQCQCPANSKSCGTECIASSACCSAADCPQGAACEAGACACPMGTHACNDACVSNNAPETCGDSCEPCAIPSGGTSSCDGSQCGGSCPQGKTLCVGECIADGAPCSGECMAGTRNCNNLCTELDSVTACGDACRACPAPRNGTATCDEQDCGIECNDDFKVCNEECIAESDCCDDDECEGDLQCLDNTCACPEGERSCDGSCVDEDACCGDDECPGDLACVDNSCECDNGGNQCGDKCIDQENCCTDDDCEFGFGCTDFNCKDNVAPQVTSISPRADATGIRTGDRVQITFSEPMDTRSVNASLTLGSILAGDLTFSWNAAQTVLTVYPSAGFSYATGSNRGGTPAKSFKVQISKAATDSVGNGMAAAFSSSFTTLRQITELVPAVATYAWSSYSIAGGETLKKCTSSAARVGAWTSPGNGGTYYIFAHFDTTSLGAASAILTMDGVKLMTAQGAPTGAFYPGGKVLLKRVTYGTIDNNILTLPVESSIGTLCSSAATAPTMDVRTSFWTEWSLGNNNQLYRIEASDSTINTYAGFDCSGFAVELKYTLP